MKGRVLEAFFCSRFNVQDISQVVPFGNAVYAWEVMKEHVLAIETVVNESDFASTNSIDLATTASLLALGDPQPRNKFLHPVTRQPMDVDLDRVCIYNIACKTYLNTTGQRIGVRLNYYHVGMSQLQQTEELDALNAESGGVKGMFAVLEPTTTASRDMTSLPMYEIPFAYQNSEYIRTNALVNESNIRNGCVQIPTEVCIQAGLPVWHEHCLEPSEELIKHALKSMQGDPVAMREAYVANYKQQLLETFSKADRPTYFVAIPINHILAWPLQSEEYRSSGNMRIEELRYSNPQVGNVLLYYLVPSTLFDHLLKTWSVNWSQGVDVRPLNKVGFEFIPLSSEGSRPINGTVRMTAQITYMAAPPLNAATISKLAPALSLTFPPASQWCEADQERSAMLKAYEARGGK